MHSFIESISDSLETMIKTRQEFFDNYDYLVHSSDDQKVPQRLCEIYNVEASEVLVEIVSKLKLSETDLDDDRHNVISVVKNFWHPEKIKVILKAYYSYHDNAEIQALVNKVENLALEMQECLNILWSASKENVLQN